MENVLDMATTGGSLKHYLLSNTPQNRKYVTLVNHLCVYLQKEDLSINSWKIFGLLAKKAKYSIIYPYDNDALNHYSTVGFTDGIHIFLSTDFLQKNYVEQRFIKNKDGTEGYEDIFDKDSILNAILQALAGGLIKSFIGLKNAINNENESMHNSLLSKDSITFSRKINDDFKLKPKYVNNFRYFSNFNESNAYSKNFSVIKTHQLQKTIELLESAGAQNLIEKISLPESSNEVEIKKIENYVTAFDKFTIQFYQKEALDDHMNINILFLSYDEDFPITIDLEKEQAIFSKLDRVAKALAINAIQNNKFDCERFYRYYKDGQGVINKIFAIILMKYISLGTVGEIKKAAPADSYTNPTEFIALTKNIFDKYNAVAAKLNLNDHVVLMGILAKLLALNCPKLRDLEKGKTLLPDYAKSIATALLAHKDNEDRLRKGILYGFAGVIAIDSYLHTLAEQEIMIDYVHLGDNF